MLEVHSLAQRQVVEMNCVGLLQTLEGMSLDQDESFRLIAHFGIVAYFVTRVNNQLTAIFKRRSVHLCKMALLTGNPILTFNRSGWSFFDGEGKQIFRFLD